MPTSRVAYLILAHDHAGHLVRLVEALAHPRASFFIHVDAKSDIRPFETLGKRADVTLLGEREAVHWGGFSQVRATLRLLRAAANRGDIGRYTLMSGVDFPIKRRGEIGDALLGSDTEFLRVDRRLDETPRNGHAAYVDRYHWNDSEWFSPRVARRFRERKRTMSVVPNCAVTLTHAVARLAFVAVQGALPPRRYPKGLVPYQGSQWWSLTDPCIRHVFRFLEDVPEFVRFHELASISDEVFFHSIVKASRFAQNISHDFEARPMTDNESGAHYIDWRSKGVPLPKTLVDADLPALLASRSFFARKFDPVQSAGLLNSLEERLNAA